MVLRDFNDVIQLYGTLLTPLIYVSSRSGTEMLEYGCSQKFTSRLNESV